MNKFLQSNVINIAIQWWWQGLLAWLPESIQQKTQQKPYIQCFFEAEQLFFYLVGRSGQRQDQIRVGIALDAPDIELITVWLKNYQAHEIVFLVPKAHFLIKQISMPAQARDNLQEMIKFEIDRQTPFTIDKVYSGYSINEGAADKTLSVTLAVVPKAFVTKMVDVLDKAAIQIQSLLVVNADKNIKIPLVDTAPTLHSTVRLNYLLAGLVALLSLFALYKPVMHYEQAFELVQAEVDTVKAQALIVTKLKQDNDLMIERRQFLDTKLLGHRSRLDMIGQLSDILPDDTWLEQIKVQDKTLTISGQSGSVSELIALLTKTNNFTDIRFVGPTMSDATTGKGRFKIQALIVAQGDL